MITRARKGIANNKVSFNLGLLSVWFLRFFISDSGLHILRINSESHYRADYLPTVDYMIVVLEHRLLLFTNNEYVFLTILRSNNIEYHFPDKRPLKKSLDYAR